MSTILPCPFCGSAAATFAHDNHVLMYQSHGCSSKDCAAHSLRWPEGFWNTRAPAPWSVMVTDEMVRAFFDRAFPQCGRGAFSVEGDRDICAALREVLPAHPTATTPDTRAPASAWVACSERMPEPCCDVLVWLNGHTSVAWIDGDGKWWRSNNRIMEPAHWQPLPAAPLPPRSVEGGK